MYAWFSFSDLSDLLKALMVGEDLKEYAKQVAPQAANAPDDTSSLEFQRGLVLLVVESRSTNVNDGAN